MKVLVILGHPHEGSFCHALAQTAVAQLQQAGHEVLFHDLYAEGFDPLLPHAEIPKGARLDPQIQKHCDQVRAAEGYIVIHPNWWAQPPAILKGWLDRVIRQGVTYEFGPGGVVPLLTGRRALVITTSNTPREDEIRLYGDPLENLWANCVFGFCGVKQFKRRNFESIVMSTAQQRQEWLAETARLVDEQFPAKP